MILRIKKTTDIRLPSPHDWRTTDADEINKRRLRAREESFTIANTDPQHPIFSNFHVRSGSGLSYSVEVRDLRQRHFTCDCVDFRINGLGTCKHVEAVLLHLAGRFRRLFTAAEQNGSTRIEVQQVSRLVHAAQRRPLTQQEQDRLLRELAMLRMICDTNYILDPKDQECPKLVELEKVLEECRENDAKVLVFSEWERMLELVRGLCQELDIGFAWHTGRVPQLRRRAEINMFKNDPRCRVFLSTDSGSTGLNLQNASVVINCDLPWNPAKLEQRIARAWRKNQTRPVTVINLVAEQTIEHRMLDTLAHKQALADGVLDLKGDLTEIKLRGGRQAFLAKLQQLMGRPTQKSEVDGQPSEVGSRKPVLPTDRPLAFAQRVHETINGALLRCEERYPSEGAHSVLLVVVDGSPAQHRPKLELLREELFGAGKSDPLAPVQLEVIDRATDEALDRLIATGLMARTTRAARPLFPIEERAVPPPLTPEERQRATEHREKADHALRVARALGVANFLHETRAHLIDAALHLARAFAVEQRVPGPASLEDALLPPLSHCWQEPLPLLRTFMADATQPWQPLAQSLEKRMPGSP